MGASNALRAYRAWGAALDDRPLRLLVYMALVAKDSDIAPWYGLGHAALAQFALGMDVPDDPAKRDAVLRKVRRAVTPLLAAGAIETAQRATYSSRGTTCVKYRLHLNGPPLIKPQVTQRPMSVDNSPNGQVTQRPMDGEAIGHSTAGHRSLSDRPQVTQRPTKEEEEEEERINPASPVDYERRKAVDNLAEPSGEEIERRQTVLAIVAEARAAG